MTKNYQVEKNKNMYEGEVDSKREDERVDYNERDDLVERKKTTKTLRDRTKIFGETRMEKVEREREKIKVEKRERDKVERGKKVTEKRKIYERDSEVEKTDTDGGRGRQNLEKS